MAVYRLRPRLPLRPFTSWLHGWLVLGGALLACDGAHDQAPPADSAAIEDTQPYEDGAVDAVAADVAVDDFGGLDLAPTPDSENPDVATGDVPTSDTGADDTPDIDDIHDISDTRAVDANPDDTADTAIPPDVASADVPTDGTTNDVGPDPGPPAPPLGLSLVDVAPTAATIGWNASPRATHYRVYTSATLRGTSTGTWLRIESLAAATSYTVTVTACDGNDRCSAPSAPLEVTTPALPVPAPRANEPPSARGETFFGVPNTQLSITDVRNNDVDPNDDVLTVTVETPPAFGTLSGPTNGGVFTYTPNQGFIGADAFTYRITDGHGGHDTAEVRIHVANRTFHVDPAGNDNSDGLTPANAWRTLGKVAAQQNTFQPGDLILLKRGSTFRESLNFSRSGTAERPIVIGAYGTGPRPVISGGRPVTGWSVHSGSVWKANVTVPTGESLKHVHVNGAPMTVARFPNTGWLRTDGGSKNHLLDAALTAPAGTYNGARVVLHTVNWAFEMPTIATHTVGRLDFAAPTYYYTAPNDWGYFIENKLSLLDAPGEYFHDATAGVLYLQPPVGVTLSNANVDVVSVNRPFQLRGNYQVADGLEIRHGVEAAVFITYLNHHVTVRDCEIHEAVGGLRGFADDVLLHENLIHDTYDFGLNLDGARNTMTRNRLTDLSMVPGLGKERWGYFGLHVGGSDAVVRHNHVERVGYIAFSVQGDRHLIEENHVRHGVSILNDGGNFAFDFLDGVIFRRNIALEPLATSPSASTTQTTNVRIAFNYYFGDKRIQNTTLEHNIGGQGVTGIHVDHTLRSVGNIIRDNLMWNHTYGVTFSDFSNYVENTTGTNCKQSYDDTLLRNTIFAANASQHTLHFLEVYCLDFVRWGTFNQNRYLNPFNDKLVYRFDFISPRNEWRPGDFAALHEYFTLPQWKAEPVGLDAQSTSFTLNWTPPTAGESTRLVVNTQRGPRRVALDGQWLRLDGTTVSGTLELTPWTGEVLLRL